MVIVGVCRARMAKNKDFLFLVYLVEYPVTPWRYGNGRGGSPSLEHYGNRNSIWRRRRKIKNAFCLSALALAPPSFCAIFKNISKSKSKIMKNFFSVPILLLHVSRGNITTQKAAYTLVVYAAVAMPCGFAFACYFVGAPW